MALSETRIKMGDAIYVMRRTKQQGCGGCLINTKFRCPVLQYCSRMSTDGRNYRCERVERVTDIADS